MVADASRSPLVTERASICVIVPSRGRPERFAEFMAAWVATTDRADLLLALDDDDPRCMGYEPPSWVDVRVQERLGLMPTIERYAAELADAYDIVGHLGDDHHPRTPHWDTRIAEALSTPGIAFGDDLLQPAEAMLPTHVFFSSEIIRALGRMCCPGVRHFGDNYWRDLGLNSGMLRRLGDVVFEHMHPFVQKAQHDGTYLDGGASVRLFERDRAAWTGYYAAGGLDSDVATIMALGAGS